MLIQHENIVLTRVPRKRSLAVMAVPRERRAGGDGLMLPQFAATRRRSYYLHSLGFLSSLRFSERWRSGSW
jgi:hypothetical protein